MWGFISFAVIIMVSFASLFNKKKKVPTKTLEEKNPVNAELYQQLAQKDPQVGEAMRFVVQFNTASASFLQRKMSIGYARAARLIDELEELGVVGKADGAMPRDVLLRSADEIQKLNSTPVMQAVKENREKQLQEQKKKAEAEYHDILSKYQNYVEKFCQIAERQVSILDEWGDENKAVLPKLKKDCIVRIAKNIYAEAFEKNPLSAEKYIENWFSDGWGTNTLQTSNHAPYWVQKLFNEDLPDAFIQYHDARKAGYKHASMTDFNTMSGIDFENYIANLLKDAGYNVSGTPKTGDQGADLIASKNNTVFVIQAKRYVSAVGNEAVQQAVAARNYYKGDVAVVITNSTFTSSAVALAKKNNVILINDLASLNLDQSLFI